MPLKPSPIPSLVPISHHHHPPPTTKPSSFLPSFFHTTQHNTFSEPERINPSLAPIDCFQISPVQSMAEEEVVVAVPSDHKRKLEEMEPTQPSDDSTPDQLNSTSQLDALQNADLAAAAAAAVSDASEPKRLRLEDNLLLDDAIVTENGCQAEKVEDDVHVDNTEEPTVDDAQPDMLKETQETHEEAVQDEEEEEQPATLDNPEMGGGESQQPSVENPELAENDNPPGENIQQPSADIPQEEHQPSSDADTISRKMEVPNNKVGVLIGKAGDTIRYLQYNSGAKIQIMRDSDADPYAATRPVELIGSLENINKAEKLIKDVIAEADAGGSPSLVARGFATAQAAGVSEQIQIQVPNEKVGLIIGRGGETIKSLQTRSGARIQLIPQHLPEGDQSKERTVRVSGDKKQIDMARELIKEVMNQPVKQSAVSTGYNQQGYRPRAPAVHSQWGPRGSHPVQSSPHDYHHRGPYSSQGSQYPPQTYGNYPQQLPPRSSFGSGWEQRPSASMQGPPQSGGYDYYGGPGGHVMDGQATIPHSASIPSHGPGPSPAPAMAPPHSQANYNYGQPHGPDYGQPAPYTQSAPSQQSYGHGYEEIKYENQAPTQHPYGHGSQQIYPQAAGQAGYGQQQQYGKPPSYGMPSQGHPPQSYGPSRASQPGDYQGHISSAQSYGQNVSTQQPYPYAASGPMQQSYAPYGSQPTTDGYNQPATTSGPGFPQQGGQTGPAYGQPGGQQAPGYAQGGPAAGYGSYPSSQPGYTEQQAPNNAGYGGYQGTTDPGYGSGPGSAYAPPSSQPSYAQPPTQVAYDQSVPQSAGGYGSVPGSAPVGYGKSSSPQPGYPQYDSTQMYGAPR